MNDLRERLTWHTANIATMLIRSNIQKTLGTNQDPQFITVQMVMTNRRVA